MNIDFHTFVANFVMAVEAKDTYTAGHSDRVADIALVIAKQLKLTPKQCESVHIAGHLHDIGKIGIPDGILLKSGKLTLQEYEVIKCHSVIGYKILKENKNLQDVALAILHHHEKYDGTGYPSGLVGTNIPLTARIISIADAFDAMVTRRTYKSQMSVKDALTEIRKQCGRHFDPLMVKAFIEIFNDEDKSQAIYNLIDLPD